MGSNVVLSGKLDFLSLGDILQLLGSSGATGVLRIMSKYSPEPGAIYFKKGNIINASTPSQSGLEAVYSLFGWLEGDFEFSNESVNIKRVIKANKMEIILDGLRLMDDGKTKPLGPVTYERSKSGARDIPLIKGPLVDYLYVLDEETFPQGYKIVQENRHGSWIWVILEGVVDVVKETPGGPLTLIKLGTGSFIGSVASFLFHDNIRKASAHASTDVQLGVLDTPRLAEEYAALSNEFKNFIMSLDNRRNEVTDKAVKVYLKKDNVKEFTRGMKRLINQGQKENRAFMIKKGRVKIVQKTKFGYLPLANLGKGDFFGAIPFIDIGHEPIKASVFASKDLVYDKLDMNDLREEYDELSPTLKNLIESIATSTSITTRVACDFLKNNSKSKH